MSMTDVRRHLRKILPGLMVLAFCVFGLAAGGAVLAQGNLTTNDLGLQYGANTGLTNTDIRVTIANIIRIALGLLGVLAVLIVLYAGFTWMTAGGEVEKVDKAKKTLTAGVIGLLIIVAAFGIVSYIISALITATGGGGVEGPPGGPPSCLGLGCAGGAGGFRPTSIRPSGTLGKRDVVVSITFSQAPISSSVSGNVVLEKIESNNTRTPVDITAEVSNNTIKVKPTAPCPAPNTDRFCLEANADYRVTVKGGLKGGNPSNPASVSCFGGAVCTQTFRTGDTVAVTPPTARITEPTDGQSVPVNQSIAIQSLLTDDNGVGNVDYYADGAFFAADGDQIRSIAPKTYTSEALWDTTGITPVHRTTLKVRVANIDGDEADSPEITAVVRPAHCFNRVKDADETATDCGGLDCGACLGGACTQNSDCASGSCVDGHCAALPKITSVRLLDGKPGNYVTITGESFGNLRGSVTFLGTSATGDEKEAQLANCDAAWKDSQIIVAVPAGAISGPIQVKTSDNRTDATNDAYGPIINDFTVNDIARPGICSVTPAVVKSNQPIDIVGNGFGATRLGDSKVQFAEAGADCSQIQSWTGSPEASVYSTWSDVDVKPTVPNMSVGPDGSNRLVRVLLPPSGSNEIASNPVCILVAPPESGTLPKIESVSPSSGAVGTYVTLLGSNFGTGGHVVFFKGDRSGPADVDFPKQCGDGYWSPSSVTVKVPAKFLTPIPQPILSSDQDSLALSVKVVRSDSFGSNSVDFTVNRNPLTPGVCRINPDNGPAFLPVHLYGERLGNVSGDSLSALVTSHPDSVLFSANKGVSSISSWKDGDIGTVVPAGAETGPVSVRVYSGSSYVASNPRSFTVRDCRQTGGDSSCDDGQKCCPNGACSLDCVGTGATGAYAFQFSTGPVPVYPRVVENSTCQAGPPLITPSPNPYKGDTEVCTGIGAVAVRFTLPMETGLFSYQGSSPNLKLESCGGGETMSATATCSAATIWKVTSTNESSGQTYLKMSVFGITPDTWYKLTVKGGLRSTATAKRLAAPLDGKFKGSSKGLSPDDDYITTFKTNDRPCKLTAVDVEPNHGLIASRNDRLQYIGDPLSGCTIMTCACPANSTPDQCTARAVAWTTDPAKATINPASGVGDGACEPFAYPVAETVPGPNTFVNATIEDKTGTGDLHIEYAKPYVVKYGPRDCNEACVNTLPFAVFSTHMLSPDIRSASVIQLKRCVNESCLSFDKTIELSPAYDASGDKVKFNFTLPENLDPNTFYRAIIWGGPDGARSDSGVPLTGLNYLDRGFSWIFRTRADSRPCSPNRIDVSPQATILHFIGEKKQVSAEAYTPPDTCSADGQLLQSNSLEWDWSKEQHSSGSVQAFDYFPYVMNNNQSPPPGCTTACTLDGSLQPGTPICGNGIVENGEACDPPGNGCSDRCLKTGNTNSGSSTAIGLCGNGAVEPDYGEECDKGALNGNGSSGCSSKCLLTGSIPGVSVCGNGSVGEGEECDRGSNNGQPTSGCTTNCLLTGSDQGVAVCGNGRIDQSGNISGLDINQTEGWTTGEECDYVLGANGKASKLLYTPDGRNAASIALTAQDETDPRSAGFACSPRCLFRGNPKRCSSFNDAGCCGNGAVDYSKGENCDAGLARNGKPGSGCSSLCTKVGEDPSLGAFCGDTRITIAGRVGNIQNGGGEECEASSLSQTKNPQQYVIGENHCDAGNDCTASAVAKIGNVAGKGSVAVQCSCVSDGDCTVFEDDLACGAGGCCFQRPLLPDINPKGGNECMNARITVKFQDVMDAGSLSGNIVVEQCGPVNGAAAAQTCGNGVVEGTEACDDGNMSAGDGCSAACAVESNWTCSGSPSSCHISRALDKVGKWFGGIVRTFTDFFVSLVGLEAKADRAEGACSAIKGAFVHNVIAPAASGAKPYTMSIFTPEAPLPASSYIHVRLIGGPNGAKSVNGVGYAGNAGATVLNQPFQTGDRICTLDVLQISPAKELIQASNKTASFQAEPLTNHDGQLVPIVAIPSFYDWRIDWNKVPGDILDYAAPTPPDTANPTQQKADLKSTKGKNGKVELVAVATVLNNTTYNASSTRWVGNITASATGTQVSGKSDITVMLCENPWPTRNADDGSWSPYVDSQTHFETYYCRDGIDSLLELKQQPTVGKSAPGNGLLGFCHVKKVNGTNQYQACSSNSDCGGNDVCDPQDLFFQYVGLKPKDVIGVKVFDNPRRLDLMDWYESMSFSGQPSPTTVDGYDAVIDGRTAYVSVPDKYGDPEIRSYVFVLAYSDNPDLRTVNIFGQILANIKFNDNLVSDNRAVGVCRAPATVQQSAPVIVESSTNTPLTCSSDLGCLAAAPNKAGIFCDAPKDKLQRDAQRWKQLRAITGALSGIQQSTGSYPKIDSGSFIRGMTTSAWPSWRDLLGQAGTQVDPLNNFRQCAAFGSVCSVTKSACASNSDCDSRTSGDVCRPRFDPQTCYDSQTALFLCPDGSHVYQYRSIGGTDYILQADLEYQGASWTGGCSVAYSQSDCEQDSLCRWDNARGCIYRFVGTQQPESNCAGTPPDLTGASLNGAPAGADTSAVCGNGVIEGAELCELGQSQTVACPNGFMIQSCGQPNCQWQTSRPCPSAAVCGNGSIEASETCDDGPSNGQYNRCRTGTTLGCAKRCVNTSTSRTNPSGFSASRDIGSICANNAGCPSGFVCTDRQNFCGDGLKNGPEACDDGVLNGTYDHCAWNCSGSGPRCGDQIVNGQEQCDGNKATSVGVCVPGGSLSENSTPPSDTKACSQDSDCDSGTKCALCPPSTPEGLPQNRVKSCVAPGGAGQCTFESWSKCQPSGSCGNGVVEGREECDSGSANSWTGTCLPSCKRNACGDGYLNPGVEQCDNGAQNGVPCAPPYGGLCNYCLRNCTVKTLSGAFCGDKLIQGPPAGPETCDPGPVTGWCGRTYLNLADNSQVKKCGTNNDCTPGRCRYYVQQTPPLPQCGNHVCDPGENESNCSLDCLDVGPPAGPTRLSINLREGVGNVRVATYRQTRNVKKAVEAASGLASKIAENVGKKAVEARTQAAALAVSAKEFVRSAVKSPAEPAPDAGGTTSERLVQAVAGNSLALADFGAVNAFSIYRPLLDSLTGRFLPPMAQLAAPPNYYYCATHCTVGCGCPCAYFTPTNATFSGVTVPSSPYANQPPSAHFSFTASTPGGPDSIVSADLRVYNNAGINIGGTEMTTDGGYLPSATLNWDLPAANLAPAGNWRADMYVTRGPSNPLGTCVNHYYANFTVRADTTAPTVNDPTTAPAQPWTSTSDITVTATANDNVALSSITCDVDGNTHETVCQDISSASSWVTSGSCSCHVGTLPPGPHTLTVRASDLTGNSSSRDFPGAVLSNLDVPAPTIVPANPVQRQGVIALDTVTSDVAIRQVLLYAAPTSGPAWPPPAGWWPVAYCPGPTMNEVFPSSPPQLSVSCGSSQLVAPSTPGVYTLNAVASDYSTNFKQNSVTGNVVADTTDPTIANLRINPGSPMDSDTVTAQADLADDAGIGNLTYSISGESSPRVSHDFSPAPNPTVGYSAPEALGQFPVGSYTLTATVTDINGRTASATLDFTVTKSTLGYNFRPGVFSFLREFLHWNVRRDLLRVVAPTVTCEDLKTPGPNYDPEHGCCWSSADCGSGQYCDGGEGQCLQFNVQCTPDPYSNVRAAASSDYYHDGSCYNCSGTCLGSKVVSPLYCGDNILQTLYGEQCDGQGDPNATGSTGTTYVCGRDCQYDQNGGYCGNGKVENGGMAAEGCDGTAFPPSGSQTCGHSGDPACGGAPSCSSLDWGQEGAVSCGPGCQLYGGGCSEGALSPGDVRVKVEWTAGGSGRDLDSHFMMPTSSATDRNIGYNATHGSVLVDPHVWWSWDDTSAGRGSGDYRGSDPHGLEIMTVNWRANGRYWPSTNTDPYKFYLYGYSGDTSGKNFADTRVTVCTYDPTKPKNANCNKTITVGTGGGSGNHWHVFDLYGTGEAVPYIVTYTGTKLSNCGCSTGSGACGIASCPDIGL